MLFAEYCEVSGAKASHLTLALLAQAIKRTNSPVIEACAEDLCKDYPESCGELFLLNQVLTTLSRRRGWILSGFSSRGDSTTLTDFLEELDLLDKRIYTYTTQFGKIASFLCEQKTPPEFVSNKV